MTSHEEAKRLLRPGAAASRPADDEGAAIGSWDGDFLGLDLTGHTGDDDDDPDGPEPLGLTDGFVLPDEVATRTNPVVLAALDAFERGLVPIPLRAGEKAPRHDSWTTTAYSDREQVENAFCTQPHGAGVGVRLGNGLVDVDLDSHVARSLAPLFLPATRAIHGRPGAAGSHWWYRLADAEEVPYVKFRDRPGKRGRSVLEVRADSRHQTAIPPTAHPSGEVLAWHDQPWQLSPVTSADLRVQTSALAVAAILAASWTEVGARNDAFMALAGALLRGYADDDRLVRLTALIVRAVATATGDNPESRVSETVWPTVEKLRGGQVEIVGWLRLSEILAADTVKAARHAAERMLDGLGLRALGDDADTQGLDDLDSLTARYVIEMRARRRAQQEVERLEADENPLPDMELTGAALFDLPSVEPLFGPPEAPVSAAGQAWMIAGEDGSGKTSDALQYVKARLGLDGWEGEMWGRPVRPLPSDQGVYYLAMDRPRQALEAAARGLDESTHGPALRERLRFWQGPTPYPMWSPSGAEWVVERAQERRAGLVVIDSRKDAGDATNTESLSGINRLVQALCARGVEVLILHHPNQGDRSGREPRLTDVYGMREVYSGLGSVVFLDGCAGEQAIRVHHLKPIREKFEPFVILRDHASGRSRVSADVHLDIDLTRVQLSKSQTAKWAKIEPLLTKRADGATPGELAQALALKGGTGNLSKTLEPLVRMGLLHSNGRSRHESRWLPGRG